MTTEDTVTLGPVGDQWLYSRATRTFDLTRGKTEKGKKLTMETTHERNAGTALTVDPSLCALVVVDMQNFFLHPDCRDHPLGLAAVAPTLRVVEKCRAEGIQVVWLNWGLTDEDLTALPAGVQRGFARALLSPTNPPPAAGLGADLGSGKGRTLVAGAWNSALYAPLLAASDSERDTFVAKNRMSGMWTESQPLFRYLKEAGKRTLFFAGVNTDQCVLGTLVDAYNNGWDVVAVDDCCATTTPTGRETCLWNISKNYGFVVDSHTFTAATSS